MCVCVTVRAIESEYMSNWQNGNRPKYSICNLLARRRAKWLVDVITNEFVAEANWQNQNMKRHPNRMKTTASENKKNV